MTAAESDVIVVDRNGRREIYARNLPTLAAHVGDQALLHRFDRRGYVPITPVMLRGDGPWAAEDDWSTVRARLAGQLEPTDQG